MLMDRLKNVRLIICVGAGGVGKTSISAALGVMAASLGKKTLVMTIDPARRLADALGINEALDSPTQLPMNPLLFAMMFDVEKGWKRLLERELGHKYVQSNLTNNRFFEHLTKELPGSHEFIACDEVYNFIEKSDFDLIILDTPPAAQGVQFLSAPQSLISFFENDLFTALLRSKSMLGSLGFGLLDRTGTLIKRGLNYFVERSFLEEMFEFVFLLRDLYPILTVRAKEFQSALSGNNTEFVVIARATKTSLRDAADLIVETESRLYRSNTLVLNQVSPLFDRERPINAPYEKMMDLELRRAEIELQIWQKARLSFSFKQTLVTVPRLASHSHALERIAKIAEKLQTATDEESSIGH